MGVFQAVVLINRVLTKKPMCIIIRVVGGEIDLPNPGPVLPSARPPDNFISLS